MPEMGRSTFTRLRFRSGSGAYLLLPVLTTAQRDALSAETGMAIYNSTTGQVEEYNGSSWRSVGQAILTTHENDLDAHTYQPWDILRTGEYHCPPHTSDAGNVALSANTLYAVPFVAPRASTWDRIAIEVTTLAAGASARLGIYRDGTNLYPGTLLLDAGTVSVATTGIKTITISQALTKGRYWLAIVSDGAPNIMRLAMRSQPGGPLGMEPTSFTLPQAGWQVAFTYAALPDPYTAGGSINYVNNSPVAFLRLLSLD